MAYNSGYPVTYPYYQGYQSYNNNQGIIWVQGEAGAKSYMIAPNTTVQLWDSEAQTIYLKSADASGMPSIKVLDYNVRAPKNDQKPPLATSDNGLPAYATKDDLKGVYERLRAEIEKLKGAKDESDISGDARRESGLNTEVQPVSADLFG